MSPRKSSSTGRWVIVDPSVSKPRGAVDRYERPPRRGQIEPVDRRDGQQRSRVRRGQLGDQAAVPRERPGQRLGAADGLDLERIGEWRVLDRQAAGRASDDGPRHDPDVLDGDGLGAGVVQLVDDVLRALTRDLAAYRDRDAGSADRLEARPGADPREVAPDVVD